MPTTQTQLFDPPSRSAAVDPKGFIGISFRQWLFSLQYQLPLRVADTSSGSYAEALPPAGVNAGDSTGQSAQNQELIYIKSSADANTLTITGAITGTVTLSTQYQVARFKSDGTVWWLVSSAGGGGSGPNFGTAGQGGFFGPGLTEHPHEWANEVNLNTSIVQFGNEVRVRQFILETGWTISRITAQLSTGAAGGRTFNFGIYNAAGAQLLDSGAFDGSITTLQTKTITPVAFTFGAYFFAQTASSALMQVIGVAGSAPNLAQIDAFLNANATRVGIAANAASGGALPATLGALTPETVLTASGTAIPFFEP
jgi:hypothetical protein